MSNPSITKISSDGTVGGQGGTENERRAVIRGEKNRERKERGGEKRNPEDRRARLRGLRLRRRDSICETLRERVISLLRLIC